MSRRQPADFRLHSCGWQESNPRLPGVRIYKEQSAGYGDLYGDQISHFCHYVSVYYHINAYETGRPCFYRSVAGNSHECSLLAFSDVEVTRKVIRWSALLPVPSLRPGAPETVVEHQDNEAGGREKHEPHRHHPVSQ